MPIQLLTLLDALRAADAGRLAAGWLYLRPDEKPSASAACCLVTDDDGEPDGSGEAEAARLGFTVEALDTGSLEDIMHGARQLSEAPTDDLIVEAFVYYLDYDAFLPSPGFVPLPLDEAARKADRDFLENLGPERPGTECRREGCSRGTVALSVLCRAHQFETVWRRLPVE